ncbi:Outer membrane protein OmpA [Nonomuraea solani]|uniref:Outer membrane protein OmpA n=1 Tax=Nonomuraea solani TaxID=1144553 RepID=A0A1H6EPS7_9ACTN|nr:OmpA family protein [Nonomuraea solani]SEG99847.1 Outer membrane protein OmpA [Nonomuraea solani]
MRLRILALLPVLAALMGPEVPAENLREAVLDLRLTVEPLRTDTTEGLQQKITISSDVLFAFDEATLTPVAARHLTAIADRLRGATGAVRVDGYTDAKGATGYNLGLSRRRAESVKQELDRILGGTPRVVAAGHGEANPVAPNTEGGKDDPAGRAKNRRVVIRFDG